MGIVVLDGAVGTELERRGVATAGRGWSAGAVRGAPEVLEAVHRAYAEAGAVVHTAATFRTTPRGVGPGWEALAAEAVAIARRAVPAGHRVAGSLAPLEDCWRPDLSPADPGPEHRAIAGLLAAAGVDLLACETFAHPGEAIAAVEAAVATGLETWAALTPGPSGDLLAPAPMRGVARRAIDAGARAVLVNCVPASRAEAWLAAIADLGVPYGIYANAGDPAEGIGWGHPEGPERYAALAGRWIRGGATIVGGCCGTGAEHVREIAERFR